MSKVPSEQMRKFISEMIANRKQRKFKESCDLQIQLRDYDPEKDKRFSGAVRLPFNPHPRISIGVIGNLNHCDQAKALDMISIDQEGLKRFNKEKKAIKKFFKPFDVLIASESLMKVIPKLLGNILVKIGKFPIALGENETIASKVVEVKGTVRFQLKKTLVLGTAFGTDELTEEQLRQNLTMSINFLVSLLKKGWQNIKSLHIKTSMGKAIRIYG